MRLSRDPTVNRIRADRLRNFAGRRKLLATPIGGQRWRLFDRKGSPVFEGGLIECERFITA
jgi:hypothetical protein